MTISLYRGGIDPTRPEVVVQTNCTTLDAFITELADVLENCNDAERAGFDEPRHFYRSVLKNAFPVAFAISGYKADRVTEAKLLTCGAMSPDGLQLLSVSMGTKP